MGTWYERGIFYHMYPLGMTGAPRINEGPDIINRSEELDKWIPHICSLGCNTVCIGPLFEPSSHGYDTRDYKLVDRRLGDDGNFRQLTSPCHGAGIRAVVGGVFNHTGREFFVSQDTQKDREQSPYKDWHKGVNFGRGSPLGDSFGYEAWQGYSELPCLNLWNPEAKQYLFNVTQFRIDESDIDGIRLDCVSVLDFGFMKELYSQASKMKEDFWLMGEVIHGEYSCWVNQGMLHSVTNYELHKRLYSGHNDHSYFEIVHTVRRLEQIGCQLYTFVDNHGEDRIASRLNNKDHLYLVYTLLYTLPGVPSIYYGGEWGVEEKRIRDSGVVLRPCTSVGEESEPYSELTDFLSQLGKTHGEHSEFHGGRYQELLLTNRQYVSACSAERSAVITIINNDDAPATLSVLVSVHADEAVDLMINKKYPVSGGRVGVSIKGNHEIVLKIMEG